MSQQNKKQNNNTRLYLLSNTLIYGSKQFKKMFYVKNSNFILVSFPKKKIFFFNFQNSSLLGFSSIWNKEKHFECHFYICMHDAKASSVNIDITYFDLLAANLYISDLYISNEKSTTAGYNVLWLIFIFIFQVIVHIFVKKNIN